MKFQKITKDDQIVLNAEVSVADFNSGHQDGLKSLLRNQLYLIFYISC